MTDASTETRVVQQSGQARFGDVNVGVVAAGVRDDVAWARLSVTDPDGAPPTIVELTGEATVELPGQGSLRLVGATDGGLGRRAEVTLELAPPAAAAAGP